MMETHNHNCLNAVLTVLRNIERHSYTVSELEDIRKHYRDEQEALEGSEEYRKYKAFVWMAHDGVLVTATEELTALENKKKELFSTLGQSHKGQRKIKKHLLQVVARIPQVNDQKKAGERLAAQPLPDYIRNGDTHKKHEAFREIIDSCTAEIDRQRTAVENTEKDAREVSDLKGRVKELSANNLKDALITWREYIGKGDQKQRIALAVEHYVTDTLRTYKRTAKKFGVTPPTIGRWFGAFEKEAGYHVPRPKPGENFSLRDQAHLDGEAHTKTLTIRKNGKDIQAPMTSTQKDSIDNDDADDA